ncbi:MAG: PIN domain-containing protein [Candidatus Micrarchaeota archaeon]
MYYLDTYALIEYLKGNPKYKRYIEYAISTSRFNLMELYYASLRDSDEETAERDYETFVPAEVEIPERTLKNAMKFRLDLQQKKKANLSYVDAIGYRYALENKLKFLTGDKAFEGLENVEFVK